MTELWRQLTEDQARTYVDGQAVLEAWREARAEAAAVRGSMFWRDLHGVSTLVRTSAAGAQKSLGARSAETEAIYDRFVERKRLATERLRGLTDRLEIQRKLNRVYQVGRAPNVVVRVLAEIDRAGLAEQFLVVGTHAIYAYEAACGVRVDSPALATRDIDLLYDVRRHMAFVTTMKRLDSSLIGVLQKADPTFRVRRDQLQTAVNKDGFEVDLLRRAAVDGDPHPLHMSEREDDFWAVQISSGQQMSGAAPLEAMVVASSGEMSLMRAVHPLAFVKVKTGLASQPDRDPVKRPKDGLQARVVQCLWDEFLVHRYGQAAAAADVPRERG